MPLLMVLESVLLLTLCCAVVLGLTLCLCVGYPLADRDTAN